MLQNLKMNFYIKNYFPIAILVALLFLPINNSLALTSDQKLPAELIADSALCKHKIKEDICIYSGNSKFNQGTTLLQAQQITIHKASGKIKKIVASGKYSRYSTIIDSKQKKINATADLITINPDKKTLTLENDGKLIIDKDEFLGPYVEYKFE